MSLTITTAVPADVDALADAFATWPKPRPLFVEYADRVSAGTLDHLVAAVDDEVVGFLIIAWESSYPPFATEGIPEIGDFNVVPQARRHGVGTALMDEAERRIGGRSDRAGLGVGLYPDYGSAQRMYVRRGYVPDGAGVVLDGVPVPPGSMIRLDDGPVLMWTKQLR